MKKSYKVIGMSCGSCTSAVEKALVEIPGISNAVASLPHTAEVEMSEEVSLETLQKSLSKKGKYTIVDDEFPFTNIKSKGDASCCGEDSSCDE